RMSAVAGAKGDWAKQQLELMKPQATIGPYDPRDFVSDQEILNLDDPEVQTRLSMTYWNTLSTEEKDRRIAEVQGDYEELNKAVADKNRLLGSGVGNQTLANILVGGSNILVHAVDRISLGMAGTVTNWIMGPAPEGYVDPMDNPYGKKAGVIAGEIGSWFLPFKFLEKVKTVGVLGKVSPTLWRSALSGTASSLVGEAADAINDFREDGKQGLGERLSAVGINTVIAGVGDVAIRAGSKVVAGAVRFVRGKLPDIKVGNVQGQGVKENEIERGLYDEFNSINSADEGYNYLLEKAKSMDVSTEKNKSIFYAGRIESMNAATGEKIITTARELAERYADNLFAEKGVIKLTLERTPGGKWMDDLKLFQTVPSGNYRYVELGMTESQAKEIWSILSSRYADGASGAVTAFTKNVPDAWKPRTIFWSTELPQLRNNPNVDHINIR
ncbi:hypothetical protein QW71_29460, partial [Paenibacillus sp. IHB B 3415]|uniref:hypothetical protein n=1 Tax=Paenibacillus sp. IHB B 3415 TaxID=867080 RepID=UPI0005752E21